MKWLWEKNKQAKVKIGLEDTSKISQSAADRLEDAQLQFLAENAKYAYKLERERELSIISQTERLVLAKTLVITVLFAALPTLLSEFNNCSSIIWLLTTMVSIVTLVGLVLTILSQWRYKYISLPDPKDLKTNIVKVSSIELLKTAESTYYEEYVSNMYESLSENNNRRCKLLNIAMGFFLVSLVILFAMVVFLILWR